ncbi:MAG: PIG-L family deacetylase [Acidobacteriota bacterium]
MNPDRPTDSAAPPLPGAVDHTPPGVAATVAAQRLLVVAPHADDEVLGCGGLIAQRAAAGAAIRVLVLSDGAGGAEGPPDDDTNAADAGEQAARYAAARRAELPRALAALGVDDAAAACIHLDLPDGALAQHPDALDVGLRRALDDVRPDLLLVPSPLERSRDHRAAFASAHRVIGGSRPAAGGGDDPHADLRLFAYEINQPAYPDRLIDVSAHEAAIAQAMDAYASQEARHPYRAAALGLRRYRALSLTPAVTLAEGYVALTPAQLRTHSPAELVAALGGAPQLQPIATGPKLAVVVRTKDRPDLLAEALDSLAVAGRVYGRAAVVLVNDGGAPPRIPDDFPLPVMRVDLDPGRGRAGAANAGIHRALADDLAIDALAFLDDDDRVAPEHLATLAGLLGAADVDVAYTDAAVGVYESDGERGWRCRARRLPYSRDFDPDLLRFDNYIPLHTVVIRRALLERLCAETGDDPLQGPLDPSLAFFEDWDLLLRLARRTRFHHLAQVTCEYRQFRGAGHHVLGDRPRQRADFLDVKARILARHAGLGNDAARRAAGVIDRLRAETVAAEERARAADEERDAWQARYHRHNGRLQLLEAEHRGLADVHRRAAQELAQLRDARAAAEDARIEALTAHAQLGGEVQRLYARETELLDHGKALDEQLRACHAEIERLTGLVEAMTATRAWRLHQWWQRITP